LGIKWGLDSTTEPDLAPSDYATAAVQEAIHAFIQAHLAGEFPDTKVMRCDVCQADERHHQIMGVWWCQGHQRNMVRGYLETVYDRYTPGVEPDGTDAAEVDSTCPICGWQVKAGRGNNPWPLNIDPMETVRFAPSAGVCDDCNRKVVIPARVHWHQQRRDCALGTRQAVL